MTKQNIINLTSSEADLVNEWRQAQEQLEIIKKTESELRDRVIEEIVKYDPADLLNGTVNYVLAAGEHRAQLKVKYGVTVSMEKDVDADKLNQILQRIYGLGGNSQWTANNLIKWKPSIENKVLNSLNDAEIEIFGEIITKKSNKPSVSFELQGE